LVNKMKTRLLEEIMENLLIPIIKGICIAILLGTLGLEINEDHWWITMGSLQILTQI